MNYLFPLLKFIFLIYVQMGEKVLSLFKISNFIIALSATIPFIH